MSINSSLQEFFIDISKNSLDVASKTTVYVDIDYSQLGITFFGALGLLLLAWLAFECMASGSNTRCLFRQRLCDPSCVDAWKSGRDHKSPPPDIRKGRSYLMGAFSIERDKLPQLMGPGANLSYRLMGHCTQFATLAMFYSALVLVPIYFTQLYQRTHRTTLLNMISVTHISFHNPSHTWVLVISSFIMSIYWMIVIYSEWQVVKSTRLSLEHDSSIHLQTRYSLLVERKVNDPPIILKDMIAKLVGKGVDEVVEIYPQIDINSLVGLKFKLWIVGLLPSLFFGGNSKQEVLNGYRREIVLRQAELRSVMLTSDGSLRPENQEENLLRTPLSGGNLQTSLADTTVQTTTSMLFNFFCLFKTYRASTYFVTLRTMASRTILAHMYRAHSSGSMSGGDSFARITPAPTPSNVIWENVTVDRRVIVTRKFFIRGLLCLAGLAFAIPIIKIQEYAREYEKDVNPDGVTTEFGSAAWRSELLSLYLPALIQIILSQTIPRVLRLISLYYERYKTYQDVSRFVLHRTFIFQLLTIYIIVFGDVWVDFSTLKNGMSIFYDSLIVRFRRLGQDIPPVAHYFASTVILSLLTETALEMIMPGKLCIGLLNKYVRGVRNPWAHCGMVQFRYSFSMASYVTLLSIMFIFSLISPIVILFCWCFWFLSYFWNTYAFIYLNNRKYEEGASFAPTIYSSISTTLLVSQIALCIVVWSSNSSKWKNHISPQVYAFVVLIFSLVAFKYAAMKNFNIHGNDFTSLSISTDVDRRYSSMNSEPSFDHDYYTNPDLLPDSNKLDDADLDNSVNGETDILMNSRL